MSGRECLLLNVVSFTELRSAQNYIIKLRNPSLSAHREIDYLFKDGLEYVYQLWPCRLGTLQQINIDVYRRENMKIIKVGAANPVVSCNLQGQRYKFKEQQESNNQLILHFRVQITQKKEKNAQKQLIAMNNQMQHNLNNYKHQLRKYQDFLHYTNQIIKEINSDEEEPKYPQKLNSLGPKLTNEKQKNILILQKDGNKKQSQKVEPHQKSVQLKGKIKNNQICIQKDSSQNDNQRNQKQEQKQLNTQGQPGKIKSVKQQNQNKSIRTKNRKLSRYGFFQQQKLEKNQKQIKIGESKITSGRQQQVSHASSFNQIKKKSILSKYPYLERTSQKIINNKSLDFSDQQKDLINIKKQQNSNQSHKKQKNNVKKQYNPLQSQTNTKKPSQIIRQLPSLDRSRLKDSFPDVNEQKQKVNQNIKKRRQIYRNLQVNKEKNLDPIIEETKNASVIQKLDISIVKPFNNQQRKNNLNSEKIIEINELVKSPSKPNEQTNSSSHNFSGLRSLRMPTQRQIKDNNMYIPYKRSLISDINKVQNNSKSNDQTEYSPIQKHQQMLFKQKTDISQTKNVSRRKKHINFTQNSKQSIIGSSYQVDNLSKDSVKKPYFYPQNNWNLTIFSIKATTYTVCQNKAKRCLISQGRTKFQTDLKHGAQNCVQWNDKIVIKNIPTQGNLNMDVITLNNKKQISEGTISIKLRDLFQLQNSYFKSYLNKNSLAIGHIQFKFQMEQHTQNRKTISLPQIKQPSKIEINKKDESLVKIILNSEPNQTDRARSSQFSLFPKPNQGRYYEQSTREDKHVSKIKQKKMQCHPRIK